MNSTDNGGAAASGLLASLFSVPSLAAAIAVVATLWYYSKPKSNLPYPPGPKGLPIIGNLFDMPVSSPWLTYDKWFKQYGDIVHVSILGQHIILLGSADRTFDIFEKRSSLYSDRTRLPMIVELMEWDFNFGFQRYGNMWRRHRRRFHEFFNYQVVTKYYPVQIREVRALLRRLLATPEKFRHHIRHAFAGTIMTISYGKPIEDSEDPFITLADEAFQCLSEATVPGTYMVDIFPILKYVPAWFPGAKFQRVANHGREINYRLKMEPFLEVENALKTGTAEPSVAATLIETLPEGTGQLYDEEYKIAYNLAGVAYAGGADTTVSTVQSFFLAMAMFPDARKKAQAELDAVVGNDRLPEFADREHLPYIQAMLKEAMRWQQVTPLAVAHGCTEDNEYDGYFIPKDAIVVGCSWTIFHDPVEYPEPEKFLPERWLKDGKLDVGMRDPKLCGFFGFGRRMCPGRHLSDNTLFMTVASVLAVYDIRPPTDALGNPVTLKAEMTSGLISNPKPFQCSIQARSPAAERLIRESEWLGA